MKIVYIKHSSFLVELEKHILLFDYYMDGELPKLDDNKEILVFTSHKHSDHFNLKIFNLSHKYSNIHFFLGAGVRFNDKYLKRNEIDIDIDKYITTLYKRQEIEYHDIHIRTLRSTDAGVAYIIDCENMTFYHAGDLNNWCRENESDDYNKKMKQDYENELDAIRGLHIDYSFVPLDPNLENTYYLGMSYFLSVVDTNCVFPMHMWDKYEYIEKYIQNEGAIYSDKVVRISKPGQEFFY